MSNKRISKEGNRERKKPRPKKDLQAYERVQIFLDACNHFFGKLLIDYIKDKLIDLPDDLQFELVWRILHYMICDDFKLTGNPVIDIRLTDIIEKLPYLNVELFRLAYREKYSKVKKNSDNTQYTS